MSTPKLKRESAKSVVRLRNSMPDKFFSLCLMHLSVVLDLNGDSLEEILEEKPKKHMTPLWRKKESKSGLFGSQLTGDSIALIFRLIEYLKRPENIEIEGLFRIPGSYDRQSNLKDMLSKCHELNLEEGQFSPHDCASVLKGYLLELPECLMMDKFSKAHSQLTEMTYNCQLDNDKGEEKVLKAVQLLMLLLPKENTLLLECLLDLLSKIVNEKKNRMNSKSLGTLFAPHFLCPRKLSATEFHVASENFSKLTSFIIDKADKVFEIPKDLAKDIDQFWKDMENPNTTPENFFDYSESKRPLSGRRAQSDDAVNTCVTFADRKQSSADVTQTEMAKLYEHIQTMPDTAKKRKLLKQFSKSNHMNLDSCSRSSKENLSIYQRVSQSIKSTGRHTQSRTFGLVGDTLMKHFPLMRKNKDGYTASYNWNSAFKPNKYKEGDAFSYGWNSVAKRRDIDGVAFDWKSAYNPTFTGCSVKSTAETSSQTQTLNETLTAEPPETPLKKKLVFETAENEEVVSPLVVVIGLSKSPPITRRYRKRRSSEKAEDIIANSGDKTPVGGAPVPSVENEISYMPYQTNKKLKSPTSTPNMLDDLPFYTPVTSFRRTHYRTNRYIMHRPMSTHKSQVTESCV